ncbi:4-hydroxythreonine-4-phosphate dehydrogenase PdxA [Leptolyngbya sp. AN02str]|uniref:4-hydroxythreonine-4-phosphate dehydrogenase PdxA n=1 Tax=Leptolyngbya sp. AN02str TaxID=3423363 RepID=UPI003D32051B
MMTDVGNRQGVKAEGVRLAIATGDPAGVGLEVTLKALADPDLATAQTVVLVGDRTLMLDRYHQLCDCTNAPLAHPNAFDWVDVPISSMLRQQIEPGVGNAASGAASFYALNVAIDLAIAGQVQAVVTAPIAKSAWKAAGHHYPGQTELLAERAGADRFGMLFVARSPHTDWTLRTLLATTHIPLAQVPTALTPDLMTRKLELLLQCLQQDFGLTHPRIAIAGLNPHSGEQGQLGTEEQDWLIAWMQEMSDRHPQVQLDGPIPPDTMWVQPGQAWYGTAAIAAHDAYLALYHDQGLIPVKLLAFDRAVNTTIGLPFVRTSPDHGTAFNIATLGIADASSMAAAIQLSTELALQRQYMCNVL